jgi:hypothetical protein
VRTIVVPELCTLQYAPHPGNVYGVMRRYIDDDKNLRMLGIAWTANEADAVAIMDAVENGTLHLSENTK